MELEAALLSPASAAPFGRCAIAGAGGGEAWDDLLGGGEGFHAGGWDAASTMLLPHPHGWFQQPDIATLATAAPQGTEFDDAMPVTMRKRRRARTVMNTEEVESKRRNHIANERNRRKQVNQYLAVLRSLMPHSYAQRGEQASIIGGAINFVKQLEQRLQSLEAHKAANNGEAPLSPFTRFFTFPQYSMSAKSTPSLVADVEVTIVEMHANLRVLSRRRPMQLLRLVVALQGHRLTVLHLSMASSGHMVLYSLILKVENDCQLSSVDEISPPRLIKCS